MLRNEDPPVKSCEIIRPKCGRTQSSLTGFHISGGSTEGLLGRLAGAAAGGAQREVGGGGTLRLYFGLPCMPVIPRAPPVPEVVIFWNLGVIEYLGVLVEQQKNQDEN